jgi:hypothetical protein
VVAVPVKLMDAVAVLLHTTWFVTGFTAHCALAFLLVQHIKIRNRPMHKNCFLKPVFALCR